MEPIKWETSALPSGAAMCEAEAPEGRWFLADRRDDAAHGSLTLPTTPEMLEAYKAWPKDPDHAYIGDPAFRKIWAHISPQSEIIHCSRMEMLIALIERLRDPRPPAGTLVEVLEAAGFKRTDYIAELFKLDIGKGSIYAWATPGAFSGEYHGNAAWWTNLLRVETSVTTTKGEIWPTHWPESYGDVEAKAAEFLIEHYIPWVRATRIMRNTR